MILCCDLPRGKFPYLVFNLVVFGHLVSSCVTQATLETRVYLSRVYFNSHPTPLLSLYLLLSTSPPAAFPPSPSYSLSSPCRRNRPPLPESLQLALHKVCTCLLSITSNGSMARTGTSVSPESLARISLSCVPSCWGTIGLVCTHSHFLFSEPFSVVLFLVKCTRD